MDQVLLAADSAIQCTNGAGYYMHFEDFGITQNVKGTLILAAVFERLISPVAVQIGFRKP